MTPRRWSAQYDHELTLIEARDYTAADRARRDWLRALVALGLPLKITAARFNISAPQLRKMLSRHGLACSEDVHPSIQAARIAADAKAANARMRANL